MKRLKQFIHVFDIKYTCAIPFSSSSGFNIGSRLRSKFQATPVTSYLGQPSHYTHPHVIKVDEVTQGITKGEYEERRHKLMFHLKHQNDKFIGSKTRTTLAILPAASVVYSAPDVPYSFKQESNFFYLTGYCEPDSVLVLHDDTKNHSTVGILFVAPKEPKKEVWEGPKAGVNGSLQLTGVNETGYLSDLKPFLNSFCQRQDINVYYDPGHLNIATSPLSKSLLSEEAVRRLDAKSPYAAVHQLRWRKSPAECALMRAAGDASAHAFEAAMRHSAPGVDEGLLAARFDVESRLQGARGHAYPPVVAGGDRANTIHYLNADQIVRNGELVLVDAGCMYGGYCSDVTRCWPVSGRFSTAQRELYEALLDVQVALILFAAETRPVSLRDLYFKMLDLLGEQLVKLGVVRDGKNKQAAADMYCPHHVSHYLGLDVHDTETVSKTAPLEPGVVITVEPGIYFRADDVTVPERFRGIGLRIEDDVLITDTGVDVFSDKCPKTVAQIEALVGQRV